MRIIENTDFLIERRTCKDMYLVKDFKKQRRSVLLWWLAVLDRF